jgi:glycosyltransferase involved in cell wall biosynthesis
VNNNSPKPLRVAIIGNFEFPVGTASATRVRNLALGLKDAGAEVRIITQAAPIALENVVVDLAGTWEGIPYINTYRKKPNSWIARFWGRGRSTLLMLKQLRTSFQGNTDVVLIYGRAFSINLSALLMAKFHRKRVALEVCEWFVFEPMIIKRSGFFLSLGDWLSRVLIGHFSDGVIAITHHIAGKYQRMGQRTLIVPSLLGPLRDTASVQSNKNEHFKILYAGQCKEEDGFDMLCDAIRELRQMGCPAFLEIVGTDGKSGLPAVKRKECEADPWLASVVRFNGRLSDENYVRMLRSVDCLVIPRPPSITTLASFPTRLPEFLVTGLPVVTGDTGDILKYLENGKEIEVVVGGSIPLMVEAFIRLWEDPVRATQIGAAGRNRALEVFDYSLHGRRAKAFLQELK